MKRWFVVVLAACGGGGGSAPRQTTQPIAAAPVTSKPAAAPKSTATPRRKCETVDDCKARCDDGEPAACSALALRYDEGNGVTKDEAKAKALYERACAGKDPEGCYQFALGWGDDATRIANYTFACDADHAKACTNIGVRYEKGKGVTADLVKSRELAEKACRLGDAIGCGNLGLYHWKGMGGPQDLEKAAKLSRQACDGNDGSACARLSDMYLDGEGVAKDPVLARKIAQRACDLEDKWCNDVGLMYRDGVGGDKDPYKMKQMYERSCDANELVACVNLGKVWRDGDVDDKINFGKAAELFEQACKGGHTEGCELLPPLAELAKKDCARTAKNCTNWGYMNDHGIGVPVSDQAAIKIYTRGCNAKSPISCSNLGTMHRDGEGVPANAKKALQFYDRACKLNFDRACEYAKELRAKQPE